VTYALELATPKVRAVVEDHVGWIVLNNPERHNAISGAMFGAIDAAAQHLMAADDVRVVAIRGEGEKAFASGADINDLSGSDAGQSSSTEPSDRVSADRTTQALRRLLDGPKPVVAMVHGWCIGGGLLTALAADIRIAADSARFGIPAGRLGVGYPVDGTDRLVEVVGSAHAAEILLTADRFTAADASRMGLVNRVVPAAELVSTTNELLRSMCALAPLSQTASKVSIAAAAGRAERDAAIRRVRDCWASEDFETGRAAFAERREPEFSGR